MSVTNKINVLFVTCHAQRWISFEWLCQYLDPERFTVTFVVLNKSGSKLMAYLQATGIRVYDIDYALDGVSRLRQALIISKGIAKIARLCRKHQVDIVHAHFNSACIPALLGGLLGRVKMRLHTRHYADPKSYPHIPWKHYLTVSTINALSQKIVAPSQVVKQVLVCRERVGQHKIELIHHGFDLGLFNQISPQQVTAMRRKHQITTGGPVIGVVSRFHLIKGIQYIIPAFKQLLERYPGAQLVLAGAWGSDYDQLNAQLDPLPPDSYLKLPFEANIFALFPTFDVFVHVPIEPALEAFGQVYVEALAAGVPSLFTRSGVAAEVMVHRQNAWLVSHQNSEEIYQGLCAILEDSELQRCLSHNGKQLAEDYFGINKMIQSLALLYQSAVNEPADVDRVSLYRERARRRVKR